MMQVKKYVAPSFGEALLKAKNELGSEAMIVESKKVWSGGIFGFFRRQMTELTVAIDDEKIRPGVLVRPGERAAEKSAEKTAGHLANLEKEMGTLRTALTRLAERGMAPNAGALLKGLGRKVFDDLVARGVNEDAALDIGQKLSAEAEGNNEAVRRELHRLIGPGTPISVLPGQRKVVALIGPTGVGKTTTLAKLAAQFTLERGLRVGLVTSDTFRIAAIEQLKTYADILGVPLYAVDTPADAAHAMRETAACDLVLVDTGGRNHRDAQRMQELRDLLAVLRPDETHLVFSLTANPKDAFEALDAYLPMGVNRLTFTKLDEASSPGLLLNVRMRCNQPVGYLTHGQSVPDDLLPADRADFTKILLGA
ncbi:MAG TPA: flagellar biosynthesis protein FlhF [Symbiobacteriaceae bacterium]|nr:flagellar biosynthesis protein FlhF [Symbiobacteriaceae bacterium]